MAPIRRRCISTRQGIIFTEFDSDETVDHFASHRGQGFVKQWINTRCAGTTQAVPGQLESRA